MSDVEMQEITPNEVATVESVFEPKAKKAARILPMEDGTTCNFGSRANLITSIDLDNSVVTFKIAIEPIGKVISWSVPEVAGLSDFQKKVYLYGLMERVKSSLAPVKLVDTEAAIHKQIVAINAGDFNIRSVEGEDGVVALTNLQKAYALVKSNPAFVKTAKPEWADVNNIVVVTEVLNFWEGLSAEERIAIRNNAYVKLELAKLETAILDAEVEVQSEI